MTRQRMVQHGPTPGAHLALAPVAEYEQGHEFFRAHSQQFGPWFYSSSMQGRFDLPAPKGTCYLASNPGAAVREVLGDRLSQGRRIPISLTEGRVISRMPLPAPVRSANVSHDDAFTLGITGELTSMPHYDVPQAWASAFYAAGFDALTYRPRFSPGDSLALALFGEAAEHQAPSGFESTLAQAATDLGLELFATDSRGLYAFATFTESD